MCKYEETLDLICPIHHCSPVSYRTYYPNAPRGHVDVNESKVTKRQIEEVAPPMPKCLIDLQDKKTPLRSSPSSAASTN